MISAYQAGLSAGSAVCAQYPTLTEEEQMLAAQHELTHRKDLGIAHIYPEEEFIRGFLAGYRGPAIGSDGLQMYSQVARQ